MDEEQAFRELVSLVYGEGANELIRKMEPGQSDLHGAAASSSATKKDKRKRGITAGLSAVGATAGAAGLGLAGSEFRHGYKEAKGATKLKRVGGAIRAKKFASALVPLEVAGLGGELLATKILHGDTKKKVQKDIGEIPEASGLPTNRGQLTRMAMTSGARAGGKGLEVGVKGAKKLPEKVTTTKGKLVALKQKAQQVSKG